MKLLLIWLLGVPALVVSMVVARELPTKSHRVMQTSTVAVHSASGHVDFHHVA